VTTPEARATSGLALSGNYVHQISKIHRSGRSVRPRGTRHSSSREARVRLLPANPSSSFFAFLCDGKLRFSARSIRFSNSIRAGKSRVSA
jgi:hypothetical protein